jgi:hypothetical protein
MHSGDYVDARRCICSARGSGRLATREVAGCLDFDPNSARGDGPSALPPFPNARRWPSSQRLLEPGYPKGINNQFRVRELQVCPLGRRALRQARTGIASL